MTTKKRARAKLAREKGLPLYDKGVHKTKAGHLRYHAPPSLNNQYVHKVMVERMIAETPYSIRIMLPYPYQIHHMDYNKTHNCGNNFLILSPEFHSALTADRDRERNGRFGSKFEPKWKPAPEWVLFSDNAESVPF